MRAAPPVLVVGGGVSGLTCAHELLRAGHAVRLVAREVARRCVSGVAGALWLPYRAEPPERVLAWAARGFERFRELARDPATGVALRKGFEVGTRVGDAGWHAIEGTAVRVARADELPPGSERGLAFVAPVIDTSRYLDWLTARVVELGGVLVEGELSSLDEALAEHDRVVNATGLGARELVHDRALFPIRGQLLRVRCAGVERVALDDRDEERIAYVVPRGDDCILGGSAETGVERLDVDDGQTRAILARCIALDARLADAELLEVKVGLRPGRERVRLEAERPRPEKLVVHDYGHGGAGVTLSWGCAEEVVALFQRSHASR